MKITVITSGYFNPLHMGHVRLIREAKKLGDELIVIVNNDKQVKIKGSVPFMTEEERAEIVESLKYPDKVVLSIDKDSSVAKSLEKIAKKTKGKLIFAKGGDRSIDNIPENEKEICARYGIEVLGNVGGDKVQSSSWLIKKAAKKAL
ncbi:MAG: hypothetical protein A2365_00690 [Candidatus Nealsonbacteria bacterium RIFOXYB1_FULL_40_15]|uniref:Cytidyltransferase-like domain-containing protein n=2 Tax=Candidatus Nealsoniibacteriota TaxID=1817911 RepID=A0A1G2ESK5_9BACT|nr:MAG: hypothetical protein A2365_00690 [Candidatus Nealsonbacteria bacterium RIFOXYB1_FULL_40_15]OGZ28786.1 MAG: hypothetical protein A2427_01870 [Candidatus Nealsonbacteria bacterium RIFOXYC1_FULL_40_7]OGZ29064.1 MAG: hypothetical protein A2562_01125 [Candidatus Nealsonbacteria bacterium RIFOXYD1_FULL_39_11]